MVTDLLLGFCEIHRKGGVIAGILQFSNSPVIFYYIIIRFSLKNNIVIIVILLLRNDRIIGKTNINTLSKGSQ